MTLTWGPLRIDEAGLLTELLGAVEKSEPTGEHMSEQDVREDLTQPGTDLPTQTLAARAQGHLVAYAMVAVRDAAEPVHLLRAEVVVHPGHRDDAVRERLLSWLAGAARTAHEGTFPGAPLEIHVMAHENRPWTAEALAAAGYERRRTFVEMRAALDANLPAPAPLPDDLRLVTHEPAHAEATLAARNEVFAGHWGSTHVTAEGWQHRVLGSEAFRPDLSFLLLTPGRERVEAFVLSAHFAADTAATGVRELYVSHVGTREGLRGRGVGSALLGHTLAAARDAGFRRSSLSVDVDNATRALGVYERCGYVVDSTSHDYVLSLA
ncbi:GNAT family N-acetyltransferase [Amycolatopsis antarctica]|uniref:GNAT family N-acetyltransferase n=1 Tax=Amycolatopsis antarctica TaxID=1854586 RepID=A0A263CY35_9PSEU|nr:GNAT family N-acetyltransferase [Amycolatopsis antarctica]OZM70246.1 GNAT family N-acetyltransferase [Amycolatopsis antarctica]